MRERTIVKSDVLEKARQDGIQSKKSLAFDRVMALITNGKTENTD